MAERPEAGGRSPREVWVRLAFSVALAAGAALLLLGTRPGGALPPLVHRVGLPVLGLGGAAVGALGLVLSLRRRPFLQPGRLGGFAAALGTLWVGSYPLPYPSSHDGRPGTVSLALPFEGEPWTVRWGGPRRAENPLVIDPARCFGILLEPPGADAAVLAPAAGRRLPGPDGELILEVAEGEFLILGGLRPAPGLPGAGERVEAGSELGRVVARGLLLHLQDRPEPGSGEGIPLRFAEFLADGRPSRGAPRAGQRLSPDPPVDPATPVDNP